MSLRLVLSSVLFATACLAVTASAPALAQRGFTKGRPGPPTGEDGPRRFIRPSGLVPSFPAEAACPAISSPFGSPTRYDGSSRLADLGQAHGGIDVTLNEGTPLLAIASGTVVHLGSGGQAEGNYLWLQHAPEDTGLAFWVYSKYQHLAAVPKLALGEKVVVGQVVALSGKTGTVGGHYGGLGYAHLHLTTVASLSDSFERRGSRIFAKPGRLFDPVAIYVPRLERLDEIEEPPSDRKAVPIPYVAEDGTVHPPGSRVVWPVACKSK